MRAAATWCLSSWTRASRSGDAGSAWAAGAAGEVMRREPGETAWKRAKLGQDVLTWLRGLSFSDAARSALTRARSVAEAGRFRIAPLWTIPPG